MPHVRQLQSAFNHGVLDPLLSARRDLDMYYKGAETLKNVYCLPQGGVTRRGGLERIFTSPGSTIRFETYVYGGTDEYILIFENLTCKIYNAAGTLQDTLTTPYATADLADLNFTQSANSMIICHEDDQPQLLYFSGSAWSITGVPLRNMPSYDFDGGYNDAKFNIETRVSPTITVTVGADNLEDVAISGGTSDGINRSDPAVVGEYVRITATTGTPFVAAHEGGIFEGSLGGRIRMLDYKSSTEIWGRVLTEITEEKHYGHESSIQKPVWNSTNGWPRMATFHSGRLVFAGSTSLPEAVWMSKTNAFFDFDVGGSYDDEGIFVTLDTDIIDEVRALNSGRHLQLWTIRGDFYCPDNPIKVSNVGFLKQDSNGSNGITPEVLDGATFFIDRNGGALREFLYSESEQAYTADSASLWASHLVKSPVDIAPARSLAADDANYLFVVNGDGTAAVFNSLRAQEVLAWSELETQGEIEHVAEGLDNLYFVVKRNIDGVDYRFIEKHNSDALLDSSVIQTITGTTVSNLAHLNGEECYVMVNGKYVGKKTPSAGAITLDSSVTSATVEVGLYFEVKIKPMSLDVDFKDGPLWSRKKRVIEAFVDAYESGEFNIDGHRMNKQYSGGTDSGKFRVSLLGYSRTAQIEITQPIPGPLTIRGIELKVEA